MTLELSGEIGHKMEGVFNGGLVFCPGCTLSCLFSCGGRGAGWVGLGGSGVRERGDRQVDWWPLSDQGHFL